MLQALISPLSSLVGTWLQGRVDKSKAESEVKVARAKAEAKVFETEATSAMLNERSLTDQMGGSWKDEFWSLIFGGILICSFLPFTQDSVRQGFEFLEKSTPDWFTHIILISVSASYGLRVGKGAFGVLQNKMEKRNAKR